MIDMHCHILPGIDDGADELLTSTCMLKMAEEHGTKIIVATPHLVEGGWGKSWKKINELCEELNQKAKQENIEIKIYPGAEVAMSMSMLELFKEPGEYCLNNKQYMLVELPATHVPIYADEFFFRLQAKGIKPILAHPERNSELIKNPTKIQNWVDKGILMQVNAPSLTGRMGERVKKTAELLLNNGWVHIIGSDAHGLRARRPILTEAEKIVTTILGAEDSDILFRRNPLSIINGQDESCLEQIQPRKMSMNNGCWNIFKRMFS